MKKHEILATLIAPIPASLMVPMASSLVWSMLGKGVMNAGSGYNKMDHMSKTF